MTSAKWLAVLAAALLCGGCLGRPAPPGVVALGVDLADDGYRWSFHMDPGKTTTATTRTLEQALAGHPRPIALHQVRMVTFSPRLTEQGLTPVLDQLLRQPDLPRGAAVVMSPDPFAILEQPVDATTRLHHLRARLMGAGGDGVLPMAVPGRLAVLKGDRLVGVLNPAEVTTLALLQGTPGPFIAELPDPRAPDRTVVLQFDQPAPPHYRTGFYRGRPWVGASLALRAEVLDAPPASRPRLPRAAADYWRKERIEPLLLKLYSEWEADPLDLAQRFRLRFPTLDAWQAYRWRERVKGMHFQVQVDVDLRTP